ITSLSFPECSTDADCPDTTYCYTGPLTRTITGYSTGCISCAFLDSSRRNALTSLMYPVRVTLSLPDGQDMPESCDMRTYSNNHGNTFNGCVAMLLVSLVVSLNLAKEEGEIMLTDIFLRRAGFSWWRFTYYDDDETYMKRNKVGVINQARFELFQFLRRFCLHVQIGICTTVVLVTCSTAKDYFLDATAVLFVVDVDNLIFRSIMTARDKNFCLDATKITLDSLETWTLQFAKIAHGTSFFLVTFLASMWIKHNGCNGFVSSSAELPAVLAFLFGSTQWIVSAGVLFASSWARNSRRWNFRKTVKKLIRAVLYMGLGALVGGAVVLHHFYGVIAFVFGHGLVILFVRLKNDVKGGVERMKLKKKMDGIKERLENRGGRHVTSDVLLKVLQRANDLGAIPSSKDLVWEERVEELEEIEEGEIDLGEILTGRPSSLGEEGGEDRGAGLEMGVRGPNISFGGNKESLQEKW
ncbi:hypothetical protein TrRE_jg3941, partial [Triparma retinervis]